MVRNSGRSLIDVNMDCFEAISLCFCSDVFIFHLFPSYFSIKYSFKSYGNFYHDQLLDFLISPHNIRPQVRGSNVRGYRCKSTHISRQGTGCWSMFWVSGSHNDLKNLVMPRVIPLLVSGHLAAVQNVNQCLPLTTQGAGACKSVPASHHTGGRSCCPSTSDGTL